MRVASSQSHASVASSRGAVQRDNRFRFLIQYFGGQRLVRGAFGILIGLFIARDGGESLAPGLLMALWGGYGTLSGLTVLARWWVGWAFLMLEQILNVAFNLLMMAGVAASLIGRLRQGAEPPSLGMAMISCGISVAVLLFFMGRRTYFDR